MRKMFSKNQIKAIVLEVLEEVLTTEKLIELLQSIEGYDEDAQQIIVSDVGVIDWELKED